MPRFEQSVLARAGRNLEVLASGVIQDLIDFRGQDTFEDDVNLVACEVIGEPVPPAKPIGEEAPKPE